MLQRSPLQHSPLQRSAACCNAAQLNAVGTTLAHRCTLQRSVSTLHRRPCGASRYATGCNAKAKPQLARLRIERALGSPGEGSREGGVEGVLVLRAQEDCTGHARSHTRARAQAHARARARRHTRMRTQSRAFGFADSPVRTGGECQLEYLLQRNMERGSNTLQPPCIVATRRAVSQHIMLPCGPIVRCSPIICRAMESTLSIQNRGISRRTTTATTFC